MWEPTTSEWLSIIAIAVSAVSATTAILVFLNGRRQRRLTERQHERRLLEQELRMYQDIATGNHWNWRPGDVGPTETDYHAYQAWRYKCVDYAPLVDPAIKQVYARWAHILQNYGRALSAEYDTLYQEVTDFASGRVAATSERLQNLG